MIKKHEAQNEGFKVDLDNKRVVVGNIEIYQDHYKVNGKEEKGSLFEEQKLLVILDEVQDMVNQGEAYYSYIRLLLLLAYWGKIKLVITTATPPIWIKELLEEAQKYGIGEIKAQTLKEKIADGVGGRIDITVHANKRDKDFIKTYERDLTSEVLERTEAEKTWYKISEESDVKKKIKEHIVYNLQSPKNRMALFCSDSRESKEAFKEKIESPEKQLISGKSISLTKNESTLYDKIKEKLIEKFGDDKKEDIDSVLNEFDLTSSMAESGIFAVAHGFIDNVISCITGIPLDELNKKRFSGLDGLIQRVKDEVSNCEESKITEYVNNLDLDDSDNRVQVIQGMKVVLKLFQRTKDNNENEKLEELVSNHNLSNTIHKMLFPDFRELSQYRCGLISDACLFSKDIHKQKEYVIGSYNNISHSGIFDYLKSYGMEVESEKQKELEDLYEKSDKALEAALLARKRLDPQISEIDSEMRKVALCLKNDRTENNISEEERQEKMRILRDLKRKREGYEKEWEEEENKFKKCKEEFLNELKFITEYEPDADKYPLYELRKICNPFAIREEESEEVWALLHRSLDRRQCIINS
ncbi:DEAD/DEAH box helicase family protein [Wolbachia endosymbiont of Ctenocephalides felis wCfeT]|uniref:DEAD/DEAH box helicase family protein n=1 Tax=Wolbachia endosymbiont of Ctenocephalides felis wCfeT TaxID=2732593 RepID=UPI001446AE14|nr:DEAD/DEAH box helicase family protein [Wolbachia endosymbiont of Ctenocephalides felis wCfeT]